MEHIPGFSSHKRRTNLKIKTLTLLNDDFNDFDYVIDCLVLVCNHSSLQAEQLALITHFKGSCDIKNGSFLELLNLKKDLTLYGLDLEIK